MKPRLVLSIGWSLLLVSPNPLAEGPFMATGIKIGEVTPNSAVVWTRLTLRPERNPSTAPMVEIVYSAEDSSAARRERAVEKIVYPGGITVRDIKEAVPGTDGDVRIVYKKAQSNRSIETSWQPVRPLRDFTQAFLLDELDPASEYEITVQSRSVAGEFGQAMTGRFRTAPAPSQDRQRVVFTVSTGQGNDDQDSPDGFNIYPEMKKLGPDFFVHTGDILYYDNLAKTVELARYHWQRMYSWPTNLEFHRTVPGYFMKDDHDTWKNDCWPTMDSPFMHDFTFRQGQAIFLEQVPMSPRTHRTFRWGKDLQIWLVEGRDYRSPNTIRDGPEKTIWGADQKAWFKKTVSKSSATFKILISPTPLVGPDRPNKNDNHSNKGFQHEGDELRAFLSKQPNMTVICGDRHWQYMSVDPKTGLREYSCGPASDAHAGGWNKEDFREDYHRYMKVIGGFLSVTTERKEQVPTLSFRYHDSHGTVQFEDVLKSGTR